MTSKRFFFVLCGALLLLIIAAGGAYYLASRNLQAGTSELSQRLADEQLADQRISDLQDLDKQYTRIQPSLPIIYAALPDQKNQSQIAIDLRNIAAQSGMSLDSVSFAASTAPGPVSQTVKVGDVLAIPISFQLGGSYDQLQTFLNLQEHLNRYTNMTSLTITGSNNALKFDVTLNAFVKP
jgi:Tfp pilus assembly protein PilO